MFEDCAAAGNRRLGARDSAIEPKRKVRRVSGFRFILRIVVTDEV
jgi:hypothetical protein